jgi:hypothetical protein
MSILLREKKFEASPAEAKNHRLRIQAKGEMGIPVWEARQGSREMKVLQVISPSLHWISSRSPAVLLANAFIITQRAVDLDLNLKSAQKLPLT